MRKVKFDYQMKLKFSQPIIRHTFTLLVFPMNLPEQQIYGFSWELEPQGNLLFQRDVFGNQMGMGYYQDSHIELNYIMSGVAWLDLKKRKKEECSPWYRYPSECCYMTGKLEKFLMDQKDLISERPLQKAIFLMEKIYNFFQYQTGSTSVRTTAGEAFFQGCGVCQDYAHILITLCRASGIPARYVAGMTWGQGQTHAWVEVFDQGKWYGLDPTQNRVVDESYIKIAQGRDYQDCKLNRGVFFGFAEQSQWINVKLEDSI